MILRLGLIRLRSTAIGIKGSSLCFHHFDIVGNMIRSTQIAQFSTRYEWNNLTRNQLSFAKRPGLTSTQISPIHQRRNISFHRRVMRIFKTGQSMLMKIAHIFKKSKRPLNTDDISAFFSWLLAGNIALLIIGTTTFFSLLLYTFNTVLAQEMVAEWVGNMITKNSKLNVTFENAIVPDWKGGRIQFKNCTVSRRPRNEEKFVKREEKKSKKTGLKRFLSWRKDHEKEKIIEIDDGNYTQFDLTVEEVDISLSFRKWLDGRGIVKEAAGKGIRGVIDRTHVHWKEGDSATNYKNIAQPGDWEFENFRLEDVLVTMQNPSSFRSFPISIYTCEIPILRKNWLMLDILNAKHMSGSYDGSLFTVNRLQRFDNFKEEHRIDSEVRKAHMGKEKYKRLDLMGDQNFSKVTRFRIDNLKLDHLNAGMSGPFGWIDKGTVDLIADVIVPQKNMSMQEVSIDEIVKYYSKNLRGKSTTTNESSPTDMSNLFILDFYLRLNNPHATVPLFTNELSYVNSALIRPIVAYINSNKTYIPIRCRVYKDLEDFDGSWTAYDSLLMDDLSVGVYESFADYVSDQQKRTDRVKKVGFWSLQFILQMILWSLSTING